MAEPKTLSEKMRRTVIMDTKTQATIWELVWGRWRELPKGPAGDHDRNDLCKLLRNLGMNQEADHLTSLT